MDEEQRDMKAHKAYYERVDFVSNSLQRILQLCPCGSITKEIVDEEDTYDYLPGKRYFICKYFEVGWCPFLVQSLVISFAFSYFFGSMGDEVDRRLNTALDKAVDEYFEDTYNNIVKNQTKKQSKHAYVERNREEDHTRLWNDYFSENPTFPPHLFRRRFHMNNAVLMRIVDRLSENFPSFQQRKDATGRLGLSPLQKYTAALRMLAYGCAADAVDEYLRLGESTTLSCLSNFTEGIIQVFGDEYLRRPTPEDLQRLLDIGEIRGALNDINILDRSPVFDDILQGRAPRVQYVVNRHQYDLTCYLTDGIYPKWSTFIQSISNPQGPEAELFAKVQEAI
uniref:Uncharacterized protein n=1 Tax=Brassica oleracea var. oleracea TaxID=109376 RepID=A0A0D3DD11_BRAOL